MRSIANEQHVLELTIRPMILKKMLRYEERIGNLQCYPVEPCYLVEELAKRKKEKKNVNLPEGANVL